MKTQTWVSNVGLKRAPARLVREGLLGYLTLTINESLILDGITLRRSLRGRHYLSYPSRAGSDGDRHPHIRPLGDRARTDIERQVFRFLGLSGGGAQ